ncbi:MAG: hypothetical protein H7Z38_06785 [Rubrivivax sp.]|nr:hypothetical protein [Pyrinomonadaceae bacterium]
MTDQDELRCQWEGCEAEATKHAQYETTPLGVSETDISGAARWSETMHADLCDPHLAGLKEKRADVQEVAPGSCAEECPSAAKWAHKLRL